MTEPTTERRALLPPEVVQTDAEGSSVTINSAHPQLSAHVCAEDIALIIVGLGELVLVIVTAFFGYLAQNASSQTSSSLIAGVVLFVLMDLFLLAVIWSMYRDMCREVHRVEIQLNPAGPTVRLVRNRGCIGAFQIDETHSTAVVTESIHLQMQRDECGVHDSKVYLQFNAPTGTRKVLVWSTALDPCGSSPTDRIGINACQHVIDTVSRAIGQARQNSGYRLPQTDETSCSSNILNVLQCLFRR